MVDWTTRQFKSARLHQFHRIFLNAGAYWKSTDRAIVRGEERQLTTVQTEKSGSKQQETKNAKSNLVPFPVKTQFADLAFAA